MQSNFFDLGDRHDKLNERDPLVMLNELIDWESCRSTIELATVTKKKSKAGRKPYDAVLMFKTLIVAALDNMLSDTHGVRYGEA